MQKLTRQLMAVSLFFSMTAVQAAIPINLNQLSAAHSIAPTPAEPIDFQEISRDQDIHHREHIRIQQLYAGYKVWGADAIIHTDQPHLNVNHIALASPNNAYQINGIVFQGLEADLAAMPLPAFTTRQSQQALSVVLHDYANSHPHFTSVMQPVTELMVYIDDHAKAHWIYRICFTVANESSLPSQPVYLVDAITNTIYQQWDNIKTMDVQGGGFGGNKKSGRLIYDSLASNLPSLKMQRQGNLISPAGICSLENSEVIVKDRRLGDKVVSFPCNDKVARHQEYWDDALGAINGAYSPDNDALYAGKVIKAMYQGWYGIPVLVDSHGKPMHLVMRVHEAIENAYWLNGSMTFGDGGRIFYPLVSLGVASHEISHGFTEQHSNLVYEGQSGGLNESFSDMAAQAADYYSLGKNTWQIGSEILKANVSLRYMDDPTKDCESGDRPGFDCSIGHMKDYTPGINVHFSSGIFNKLFYRLSTSPGWDTRKAFAVMIEANAHYWTATTTFANAACGVLNAANSLGYTIDAISKAAAAVGIETAHCA